MRFLIVALGILRFQALSACSWAKGGCLRQAGFRRAWLRPAVAAAGPTGLTFHELRHTLAALWIAAGANPEVSVRPGILRMHSRWIVTGTFTRRPRTRSQIGWMPFFPLTPRTKRAPGQ